MAQMHAEIFMNNPIGVFDSGVGGLTVLRALAATLPHESFIYVGDTARVPYGNKSAETVERYAFEIAAFLHQHAVKALVVACNTVSAVALDALRARVSIPVLGVIEPGAHAAVRATKTQRIGVIGTTRTIESRAYEHAIRACDPSIVVTARACPLFVPLVEEGWAHGEIPEAIAAHYLAPLREAHVDTVVLGCTHYPELAHVVQKILGDGVTLVESGAATAEALTELLRTAQLTHTPGATGDVSPTQAIRCFATDAPEAFSAFAARILGTTTSSVELIPPAHFG